MLAITEVYVECLGSVSVKLITLFLLLLKFYLIIFSAYLIMLTKRVLYKHFLHLYK